MKTEVASISRKNTAKTLLLIICMIIILAASAADTPATFEDWSFAQQFNFSENSGTNLTAYPVLTNLDTKSLISEGKMQEGCQDIRFSNSSDVEIKYWISSGCNTTDTHIWVEVPYLAAGTMTSIDMHYGKADAISNSSTAICPTGEFAGYCAVFLDDFPGTTLSGSRWYERIGGTGIVDVGRGMVDVYQTRGLNQSTR